MTTSRRFDPFTILPAWAWLAGAALLLAVALAAYAVWRRRRAAPATAPKPARPAPLRRDRLARIWKAFLRSAPPAARRRIEGFQPFVVLGAASAGKSTLVASCTDWEGQARQFHPSHTADPLLQIYLGARVVVQELSASLLQDSSHAARRALRRLWAPLARAGVLPRVVVALDAQWLATAAPEALRELAQLVRGKVNLLSTVVAARIPVSVALTHLDGVAGHREFMEFVRRNDLPLDLDLAAAAPSPRPLAALEAHLGRALATARPGEFLKVLAFLRDTAPIFSQLGLFVDALRRTDSLSRDPELAGLFLASRSAADCALSNPFARAARAAPRPRRDPLRKHRLVAAAAALAGLAFLGAGFAHERSVRGGVRAILADVATAGTPAAAARAAGALSRYLDEERHGSLRRVLPRFAPGDGEFLQDAIRVAFVRALRDGLFVRELRRLRDLPVERERLVFYLVLTHAGAGNELGQLVRQHAGDWERVVGLPWPLLARYLDSNAGAEAFTLPDDLARAGDRLQLGAAPVDPSAWAPFFRELSALQTSAVARARLASVQSRAVAILQALEASDRSALLREAVAALSRAGLAAAPPATEPRARAGAELNQGALRGFLAVVRDEAIPPADASPQSLGELLEALKLVAGRPRRDETFRFSAGGQGFSFSRSGWTALVDRARVEALVGDLASARNPERGLAFFRGDDRYPDLAVGGEGRAPLFAGCARVDGRFTRRAYEEAVRPVLVDWAATSKALPLTDARRDALSALATGEADAYARRYVDAYRSCLASFAVAGDGETSLRAALQALQAPSSPLRSLLAAVGDNTALALGSGTELAPMAVVPATFGFVKRILPAADASSPELDRYVSILALLQRDLESDQAYVPRPDLAASPLRARSTPLGRVAIAALREEKDSYVDLVERWLAAAGVRPEWQAPFLSPVVVAAQLGLRQVEETVAAAWGDVAQRHVTPLLASFPFDRSSAADASPAQVEAALSPQGPVARTFADLVDPLLSVADGRAAPRRARYLAVSIPEATLQLAAELDRIRPSFFDKAGAPRPLALGVKPLPLPAWKAGDPVLLAHLQVGAQSVLGFNQQSGRKDLAVDWTRPQAASVGFDVQLGDAGGARGLDVPESSWSLYRLLLEATPSRDGVQAWTFRDASGGRAAPALQFQFTPDPWAPFTIARPSGKEQHETASR